VVEGLSPLPLNQRHRELDQRQPQRRADRLHFPTSSRRSPVSYLLTNDCGTPSCRATSACVRPAPMRVSRNSSPTGGFGVDRRIAMAPSRMVALENYPKIGYNVP